MPVSRAHGWAQVPAEQLPYIMAGKWYLVVRLIYQLLVIGFAAVGWWRGSLTIGGWTIAGAALIVVGYGLRRWARAVLGERFRSFEVRREPRGLETGGPYAYLRHPGYVGLAFMDIGLPLAFGVPALVVLSIAPIALIVRRARLENVLLKSVYS